MSNVSVVIPTYNRPHMLKKAIESVLSQTYQDWELIVVDDGLEERAGDVVKAFNDARIHYIAHDSGRGGSAARNTGIRVARGKFVAFLDDDDQWLPDKLEIQMKEFVQTSDDVGFCFTAVTNLFDGKQKDTIVLAGVKNYFNDILEYFSGFLNVTLVIKKKVFADVGLFDETLPSHQETDLLLRISRKHKGLGINQPLVCVNMRSGYERTGGKLERRIAGRKMILDRYHDDLQKLPEICALQYFSFGLLYRDNKQFGYARRYFLNAFLKHNKIRYFAHYASLLCGALPYRLWRLI